MNNQTVVRETRLYYYTDKKCVICDNGDFCRYDIETHEKVFIHKLNHINLGTRIIVFCDSCLYQLKTQLKGRK